MAHWEGPIKQVALVGLELKIMRANEMKFLAEANA
jgi:hypothetical protein